MHPVDALKDLLNKEPGDLPLNIETQDVYAQVADSVAQGRGKFTKRVTIHLPSHSNIIGVDRVSILSL